MQDPVMLTGGGGTFEGDSETNQRVRILTVTAVPKMATRFPAKYHWVVEDKRSIIRMLKI